MIAIYLFIKQLPEAPTGSSAAQLHCKAAKIWTYVCLKNLGNELSLERSLPLRSYYPHKDQ